jgi:hypothetical protein
VLSLLPSLITAVRCRAAMNAMYIVSKLQRCCRETRAALCPTHALACRYVNIPDEAAWNAGYPGAHPAATAQSTRMAKRVQQQFLQTPSCTKLRSRCPRVPALFRSDQITMTRCQHIIPCRCSGPGQHVRILQPLRPLQRYGRLKHSRCA